MSDRQNLMDMLDRAGETYVEHNGAGNYVLIKGALCFCFTSMDELDHIGKEWPYDR